MPINMRADLPVLQAIETKYIGPGNVRGSRVKATTASGININIEWDDGLNSEENHRAAALALMHKLRWDDESRNTSSRDVIMGATQTGYVFVLTPHRPR